MVEQLAVSRTGLADLWALRGTIRAMGEEFFSIAAQVLPTLLIALMLEIRSLVAIYDRADLYTSRFLTAKADSGELDRDFVRIAERAWILWMRILHNANRIAGYLFFVGEATAVASVAETPHGWWKPVASSFVGVSLLGLVIMISSIPPFSDRVRANFQSAISWAENEIRQDEAKDEN